jgi:hypothetical protein
VAIIPDDKDWTWVLERPCPECGFDAGQLNTEELPSLVREFVAAWQRVLQRPGVNVRLSPDKWSPLEYACHVRDVFRLFNARLHSMIVTDGAHFENWDQDETAIADRYDLQVPNVVAMEIADAGEALATEFSHVEGPLWAHKGIRSNGSEFTIATFAIYFAHDPIHHLWDVQSEYDFNPVD